MKFGTIGAGTVALAFAREVLGTGHEAADVVRNRLPARLPTSGAEHPRLR
jgi:hypothetical protein